MTLQCPYNDYSCSFKDVFDRVPDDQAISDQTKPQDMQMLEAVFIGHKGVPCWSGNLAIDLTFDSARSRAADLCGLDLKPENLILDKRGFRQGLQLGAVIAQPSTATGAALEQAALQPALMII